MGIVTVRVELKDTTLAADPVEGATVRFYDDADNFLTEEVTDVDGIVDVLLDGDASPTGIDYHVRAYKPGCSFGTPKTITVFDPPLAAPDNNDFAWSVNIFEVENSPTPGMCRVSGGLMKADGTLAIGARLLFRAWPTEPATTPAIFYDHLILPCPRDELPSTASVSDSSGVFRIDLIRGGLYQVVVPGLDLESRLVRIPDRAGVLLADLLLPIPMAVTYDPAGPFVVTVGTTQVITPEVTFSDYNTYSDGGTYVLYSSSDTSILAVGRGSNGTVVLTGVAPGAANLIVTRTSKVFGVSPERDLTGDTVAVTVNV